MKFADIVTLAKNGYKPSDIKELLELCETDPETKSKEPPIVEDKTKVYPEPETDPVNAFEELINKEGN